MLRCHRQAVRSQKSPVLFHTRTIVGRGGSTWLVWKNAPYYKEMTKIEQKESVCITLFRGE